MSSGDVCVKEESVHVKEEADVKQNLLQEAYDLCEEDSFHAKEEVQEEDELCENIGVKEEVVQMEEDLPEADNLLKDIVKEESEYEWSPEPYSLNEPKYEWSPQPYSMNEPEYEWSPEPYRVNEQDTGVGFNEEHQLKDKNEIEHKGDERKEVIKEEWEPEDGTCGVSAATALEGIYEEHIVKDELVIGPVILQPQDVAFAVSAVSVAGPSAQARAQRPAGAGAQGAAEAGEVKEAFIRTCDICHKQLASKSSLVMHKRIHTGEKPYSCSKCHRKFNQSSHLNTHERTHTGQKAFSCHICHEQFTRRMYLISHFRVHTGERPFSCDTCHKQFRGKSNLIAHIQRHTRERRFSCDICQKQFPRAPDVRRHKRIHTGVKSYTCEICHKQFLEKSHLKSHMRYMHTERPSFQSPAVPVPSVPQLAFFDLNTSLVYLTYTAN